MRILKENYHVTNTLFEDNKKAFVFKSIIEGFTPGRIYLDDLESPTYYVVLDCGNFVLYVGGNLASEDSIKICTDYINKSILTEELKTTYDSWILISCDNEKLQSSMLKHLDYKTLHEGSRTLLHHNDKPPRLNPPVEIKRIDQRLLKSSLNHIEELKEEVSSMWGNENIFIEKGFGVCAVEDDQLLSWCTAEFVSQTSCGIGIETIETAQKKGIATSLAASFLDLCYQKKITPYWDSWTKNIASIRVAEKTGFKILQTYHVLIVEF